MAITKTVTVDQTTLLGDYWSCSRKSGAVFTPGDRAYIDANVGNISSIMVTITYTI